MKKNIFFTLFGVLFLVLIIAVIIKIYKTNENRKIKEQETLNVLEYWDSHYTEEMIIESVSIIDGRSSKCHIKTNEDISFYVMYWESHDRYIDTYLQSCLEYEAEQMIYEQFLNSEIDFYCNVQLAGSPLDLYDRLYKYYQQYNKVLSWYDEKCCENLEYIGLDLNDVSVDYDVHNILEKFKEKIEILPLSYNAIIITKNKGKDVIFKEYY